MFTVRTSKPNKSNKHYVRIESGGYNTCIQGNPKDECDALANCVGYAQGRFNEIYAEITGHKGNKYSTLNCNAENFIERAKAAGLQVGSTAKPGSIMVWQKGATLSGNDGAGHVAICEKVIDSKTVYTSESGYKTNVFWNATRSNANGNWGINSPYKFRGFIYNPAVTEAMIKDDSNNCPYVQPNVVLNRKTYEKKFYTGVQWLQWHLTKLKYYEDAIDGYFGPKTENAVKSYQRSHLDSYNKQLEVDGQVGPLTRSAILATYNGKNNAATVNPYNEPTTVLTRAKNAKTSTEGVKWAQWHLQRLGYYTKNTLGNSADVAIDGYFGPNTEKAVKLFQKAKAIEVDGKVGPITRSKLKA